MSFFRVETEPHAPSRTDVLSFAEAVRGNSDWNKSQPTQTMPDNVAIETKGAENKIEDNTGDAHGDVKEINKTEEEKIQNVEQKRQNSETGKMIPAKDPECSKSAQEHAVVAEEASSTNGSIASVSLVPENETRGNEIETVKEKILLPAKKKTYLSTRNLELHNRMLRDAWMHLVDEDVEAPMEKICLNKREKKGKLNSNNQNPVQTSRPDMQKRDLSSFQQKESEVKRGKYHQKRRVIQRSTDVIFQKSKDETYSKLHEKKQHYNRQVGQGRVIRSKSNEELHRENYISENVLSGFKEESAKLFNERTHPRNEDDVKAGAEREKFIKTSEKYFTRNTGDRYKRTIAGQIKDNRDTYTKRDENGKPSVTEGAKIGTTKQKRPLVDTEREDMYMMDMEYLITDGQKKAQEQNDQQESETEDRAINKSLTKREKSRQLRSERFLTMTSVRNGFKKKLKYDRNANTRGQGRMQDQNMKTRENIKQDTIVQDKEKHDNLENHTKHTSVGEHAERKISVSKREIYRNLEASLKPKHTKHNSFTIDMRQKVPSALRKSRSDFNSQQLKFETEYYNSNYNRNHQRYTFDAFVSLPKEEPSHRDELEDTEKKDPFKFPISDIVIAQSLKNMSTLYEISMEDKLHREELDPADELRRSGDKTKQSSHFPPPQTEGQDVGMSTEDKMTKFNQDEVKNNTNSNFLKSHVIEKYTEHKNTEDIEMNQTVLIEVDVKNDPPEEKVEQHADDSTNKHLDCKRSLSKSVDETAITVLRQTPSSVAMVENSSVKMKERQSTPRQKSIKSSRAPTGKTFQTYTTKSPHPQNKVDEKSSGPKSNSVNQKSEIKTLKKPRETEEKTSQNKHTELTLRFSKKHPVREGVENTAALNIKANQLTVPPEPSEVVIRDKIKLEIDIVDQNSEEVDSEKVEQEKKKIKRFWEVVGGKDVNDNAIYGEPESPRKDKVLLAKVTKEKVMSPKSRSSKKSKISSVHNVGGDYNLTLEVN